MTLILNQRWTQQPQYPVGVNTHLQTAFVSTPGIDTPVSVNSAITLSSGIKGRHYLFTGATNNTTYVDFGEKATDIFTNSPGWGVFLFNPGPSGSWVNAYVASKSSANNTQGWNLFFTAAGAIQMNLISSGNMNWASSAGALQSDLWHTIVISYSGDVTSASCLTIWVNGLKITPASSNGGSGHTTDLTFPLRLGFGQVGSGGMSFPLNGKIAMASFGRKALVDAEALLLTSNPWQLFSPQVT